MKEVDSRHPNDLIEIAFLSDDEGKIIELIEDKTNRDQFNYLNQTHISIGFEAENIEELYKRFKADGIISRELVKVPTGEEFFFIHDPNGIMIQFISYEKMKGL